MKGLKERGLILRAKNPKVITRDKGSPLSRD